MYRAFGKRLLDLLLSIVALILLAPLLVLVAILVRIKLGSPVLFRQRRAGLGGEGFTLFKFRTMSVARDARGELLPDTERLTRFGQFLRDFSLDELPELINVLKRDMSLVGPRPLLLKYIGLYTNEQSRRHDVLPGITGWAQVNGRNAVNWEQKFELDIWYVENVSLLIDLRIIALTIVRIVLRRGINQPGHATAQEFKGTLRKEA